MNVLAAYARMYLWCLTEAFKALVKTPWTMLLPMALAVAIAILAQPLAQLGIVGGFIMGLLIDAAMSCYLYFVGEQVAKSKVTLGELKKSFGVYFWSIINLNFVLWIASMALDFAMPNTRQSAVIRWGLYAVLLVALNPTPETIYQRGTRGGIDTITTSFKFLQENWIEWFLPQLLVGGGIYWLMTHSTWFPAGALLLVMFAFTGVLFHIAMLYRGFLYQTLDGTAHRQRVYRFRKGGNP